jgi:hypothetical protein
VYTDFFGLAELPFWITPDPRFLWYSPQPREVKAKILHHIHSRKGPVYLFADVGTGKTSIAKRIHDELSEDKSNSVVFAFAPNRKTCNAFLRFVMDEFGVKADRNRAVTEVAAARLRQGDNPACRNGRRTEQAQAAETAEPARQMVGVAHRAYPSCAEVNQLANVCVVLARLSELADGDVGDAFVTQTHGNPNPVGFASDN